AEPEIAILRLQHCPDRARWQAFLVPVVVVNILRGEAVRVERGSVAGAQQKQYGDRQPGGPPRIIAPCRFYPSTRQRNPSKVVGCAACPSRESGRSRTACRPDGRNEPRRP